MLACLVVALVTVACAGTSASTTSIDGAGPTTTTEAPVDTTTVTSGSSGTQATTTTTPLVSAALQINGNTVIVKWANLPSTPFFVPASGGDDPLFHIHTNPESDGFLLSFEMYTTGYGQQWMGETGTFDITCDDPVSSTGICPYFDPDGPGPVSVKGDDFAATGSLTIARLDEGGYDIVVHQLMFSDGTTFEEFAMNG